MDVHGDSRTPHIAETRVQVEMPCLLCAVRTAWFSRTTVLPGSSCRSSSYGATICGQSVASALVTSSWTAAIAACSS